MGARRLSAALRASRARTTAGERLTFLAYRSAAVVARKLPEAAPLAELGGLACATVMPKRRAVVARHMERVSGSRLSKPELLCATGRCFVSYARYWSEWFRVTALSGAEIEDHMSFEGFEHLRAGMERGRGVILGLPHLGSWDYGGAALAAMGYPMTVVVEPVPNEALFAWFVERRRAMGLSVVPLGPGAASTLAGVLRTGGLVGLVCDRDLVGRGVAVPFFGEETTLPAGPATLALRTGAALLPTAVLDEPRGRHRGVLRPALDTTRKGALADDVARITAELAAEMEGLIRRAPEQWHLFQPNWPSDHARTSRPQGPPIRYPPRSRR